jgi:uncharacterized protein (DUF697 family)
MLDAALSRHVAVLSSLNESENNFPFLCYHSFDVFIIAPVIVRRPIMSKSSIQLFWKTITSISVQEIQIQAEQIIKVSVVGNSEERTTILSYLLGGETELLHADKRGVLYPFDIIPDEPDTFDVIITANESSSKNSSSLKLYSIKDIGSWDRTADRILEENPDKALSIARSLPGFRSKASRRIIQQTSWINAQFAMANALPGAIPFIAPLLPATMVSDMMVLTKNQAFLTLKLAAIYDKPLDIPSRTPDLLPLFGNAFGWRAIAREIVAIIPGGVGVAARGAIAYAGTSAIGKAMEQYYLKGRLPTPQQIGRYYREFLGEARTAIASRMHKH